MINMIFACEVCMYMPVFLYSNLSSSVIYTVHIPDTEEKIKEREIQSTQPIRARLLVHSFFKKTNSMRERLQNLRSNTTYLQSQSSSPSPSFHPPFRTYSKRSTRTESIVKLKLRERIPVGIPRKKFFFFGRYMIRKNPWRKGRTAEFVSYQIVTDHNSWYSCVYVLYLDR